MGKYINLLPEVLGEKLSDLPSKIALPGMNFD